MKKRKLFLAGLLSLSVAFSAATFNGSYAQENNNQNIVLKGDILVEEDSQNQELHNVKAGDEIKYNSTLDVKSIKEKLQEVENGYPGIGDRAHRIRLENTRSEFTATLRVDPTKVDFSNVTATLVENVLFKIREVDGVVKDAETGTLIVNMVLKKDYATYADLKADLNASPDVLMVNTTGAKVKDNLQVGDKIKATGNVEGMFSSQASFTTGSGQLIGPVPFEFSWVAEQSQEGRDSGNQADDKAITYTALVTEAKVVEKPEGPKQPEKPADKPEEPKQPEESADKPVEKVKKPTVNTGDETNMTFGVVAFALASAGLVGAVATRRKEK